MSEKLAAFDIDGVLTQNGSYRDDWPYKKKAAYFEDPAVLQLEMATGAKELLYELKRNGLRILLLTARPVWHFSRLAWMTYEWLRRWDIPYDRIIFAESKLMALGRAGLKPRFVVEDDLSQAISLARGGFKVYLIGGPRIDENILSEYGGGRIIIVKSLKDVRRLET